MRGEDEDMESQMDVREELEITIEEAIVITYSKRVA